MSIPLLYFVLGWIACFGIINLIIYILQRVVNQKRIKQQIQIHLQNQQNQQNHEIHEINNLIQNHVDGLVDGLIVKKGTKIKAKKNGHPSTNLFK